MNELEKQLEKNLNEAIIDFLTNPDYADIKILYHEHFDNIRYYIEKSGLRLSIEDIANIDKNLFKKIIDNLLFLKEINRAIIENKLTIKDLQ